MTEPTPNFNHDNHLRRVIENPVQGGDTRTTAEINAEAERIARAEREAADQAARTQPEHRAPRRGMSKGAKIALGLGVGTAVAVAATVGGVAAFGPKANDETTQGGSGTDEGTEGNGGGIEGNSITIEISPESLAELSTPEQISEALSIPATNEAGQPLTQAEFATELEESLEGILNSGTTDAEFAPYENTPIGEYENALSSKYDTPGLSAVFVDPADVRWISENHKGNLLMSKTARLFGDEDFKQNVDITLADTANETAPAAGSEMTIDITYLSNAEQIGLIDFFSGTPQDIEGIDRTVRYTVSVVEDGNGHLKSQLKLVEG